MIIVAKEDIYNIAGFISFDTLVLCQEFGQVKFRNFIVS